MSFTAADFLDLKVKHLSVHQLRVESWEYYLRKLDTYGALISEAYYTSIKFADNLKSEFKTTLLNKFLNGLE